MIAPHMFSAGAVKEAQAELDRIERTSHVPIVIETIESLPEGGTATAKKREIDALAVKRDKAIRDEGIYLLISRDDHLISHVLVRERLADVIPIEKRDAIREAFIERFHKGDYDGGLKKGAEVIATALEGASVGHKAAHAPVGLPLGAKPRGGQSTMGTFLLIMLGIFGVLLVLRLLGGLFGRSGGAGYNQMGGMGMQRPGMGPGYYGSPGYGGGGGFFSGMLGGLGGALAGNWLYDQFSGRHGGVNSADAIHSGDYGAGIPDTVVTPSLVPTTIWAVGRRGTTVARLIPAAATGVAEAATGAVAAATGAAVAAVAAETGNALTADWIADGDAGTRSDTVKPCEAKSIDDPPRPRVPRRRGGFIGS